MTHALDYEVYSDYYWKEGKPHGRGRLLSSLAQANPLAYKIVKDPYQKHITVEAYRYGAFAHIAYDSYLFDFRHLTPASQKGWLKQTVSETAEELVSHIRNLDDRLILVETYTFEQGRCRSCRATSPHGFLLSTQRIFYASLGDSWNGVILYDTEGKPVMKKEYDCDEAGHFTQLISESWNMETALTAIIRTG